MKKLLTIALALVMVFAIAAPAFAMGADKIDTTVTPASNYYSVDISFYKGNLDVKTKALTLAPATDMFAKDQQITVAVKITQLVASAAVTTPFAVSIGVTGLRTEGEIAAAADKACEFAIDADGLVDDEAAAPAAFKYSSTGKIHKTTITQEQLVADIDAKGEAIIYAVTDHVKGDVAVTVEFGSPAIDGVRTATTDSTIIVKNAKFLNDDDYSGLFTVTTTDSKGEEHTLEIKTTANGKVNKEELKWDGDVLSKGTGLADPDAASLTYLSDSVWTNEAGKALSAVERAAIDKVFTFFNLDYTRINDYMVIPAYFLAKIDTIKTTNTATAKLFTAALTVSDTTTVPNTGDNAAVIGFVMIALAIVAAAAVAVKKVRA